MVISDLIDLMVDPSFFQIEIYKVTAEKVLYKGPADELPEDYYEAIICSIDSPVNSSLCINID